MQKNWCNQLFYPRKTTTNIIYWRWNCTSRGWWGARSFQGRCITMARRGIRWWRQGVRQRVSYDGGTAEDMGPGFEPSMWSWGRWVSVALWLRLSAPRSREHLRRAQQEHHDHLKYAGGDFQMLLSRKDKRTYAYTTESLSLSLLYKINKNQSVHTVHSETFPLKVKKYECRDKYKLL